MSDIPFVEHQLPKDDEVFLDHVAWMTSDMDRASAAFERLGFALTPLSVHGNRNPDSGELIVQGSANRLSMLKHGYIELLAAVDGVETPVAHNIHQSLARYEGVHLVAFTVADADAEYARLEIQGVPLQPLVHLRREIEAADGTDAEVAFSVIRPAFGTFPEGRLQVLSHHTPDHMWQERYITSENHLDAVTQVVICVDDPNSSAGRLSELTRTPLLASTTLDYTRGRVRYMTRSEVTAFIPDIKIPDIPFMAVLGMRSRDLAETERFFAGRGIAVNPGPRGDLVVDAADALGCYLLIHG